MARVTQLIYTSTPTTVLSPADLEALALQSGRFNRTVDITGVLLYGSGRFLQLLEGQPDVVEDLYFNKIVHDPRHTDCKVLLSLHHVQRLLPDWGMGLVSMSTPASEQAAWDQICQAVAQQNPAAVFAREPAVSHLYHFIYPQAASESQAG